MLLTRSCYEGAIVRCYILVNDIVTTLDSATYDSHFRILKTIRVDSKNDDSSPGVRVRRSANLIKSECMPTAILVQLGRQVPLLLAG